MSKDVISYLFNFHSEDLCEFIPYEYCHLMKCDACPFDKTPGIVLIKLYCFKDKEDETNE